MAANNTVPQNIVDEFVGVSHGDLARVKSLLAQYPQLVNSTSSLGESPIQAAAQTGQREIAQLLLAAGAPLDICTAAMLGEREQVDTMLAADASLAHATGAHGIPLMYYAAISGRPDIAEVLLARGAPLNGGEGVSPPLHGAVYFDQPQMAAWLIAHGADLDARDFRGRTALAAALGNGHDEIATLLRQHGAKACASGSIDVEAGKLFYEWMGEGQPLVLIHAGIADHRMWDEQFEVFARRYRVVRYDLRGFGQSTTETGSVNYRQDLLDLMKHLGIERAILLGCSMGGSFATDFALEQPQMVSGLVLSGPGLSGFEHTSGDDPKAQIEKQAFERLEKLWEQRATGEMIELELQMWVDGPGQPSERVRPEVRERVRAMEEAAYAQNADIKSVRLQPPAAGRLDEIKVPTLVIVGDLDVTDVLATVDYLAGHIRGAKKVIMAGTAHLPNMERPDEFNRIVLEFLSNQPLREAT